MLRKPIVVVLAGAVTAGAGAVFALQSADAALPGDTGKIIYATGSTGTQYVVSTADGASRQNVTPVGFTALGGRAEFAPDGSEIAFSSEGNLYLAEPDGSRDVQLTSTGQDSSPTWNADGTALTFVRTANGTGQLYDIPAASYPAVYRAAAAKPVFSAPSGADDTAPDAAGDGTRVFVRKSGDTSAVYLLPSTTDSAATKLVDDATDPSISPDGKTVAFIRTVDGHAQVFTVAADGTGAAALTTDAFDHSSPAFSPDGKKLAYTKKTASGDTEVYVRPLGAGDETQISSGSTTGDRLPNWAPVVTDHLVRAAGKSRIDTAIQISKSLWGDAGKAGTEQAKVVVLARSDNFPDALAGGPLAARKAGPLLLTPTKALPATVEAEIKRVLAPGSTVYILGAAGAVSPDVQARVSALGYQVKRLAGANRITTALAIANELGDPKTILLATGLNFPDALSAGAAAGANDGVVLLTADGKLPQAVDDYLDAHKGDDVYWGAVGGQAVAAMNSAGWGADFDSYNGRNRYDTSLLVAQSMFWPPANVGVATGLNYPDAVAGSALLGYTHGPLLLTQPNGLPARTADYLAQHSGSISWAGIFGGPGVVGSHVQDQVAALIGGQVDQSAGPAAATTLAKALHDAGPAGRLVTAHAATAGAKSAATTLLLPTRHQKHQKHRATR